MWRVPSNPENPTYDESFKVSFWRWLTSNKADRTEWVRRRKIADKLKIQNWGDRVNARMDEKIAQAANREPSPALVKADQLLYPGNWRKQPPAE